MSAEFLTGRDRSERADALAAFAMRSQVTLTCRAIGDGNA